MTQETLLTDVRFSDLPLHPDLIRSVEAAGFEFCTQIQALTLPALLEGRDVAGQAQTGTGKTAAYLLAMMHRLLTLPPPADESLAGQPRGFALAPTRELAIQIHKDALLLSSATDLRFALAYGGVDYDKQRNDIEAGIDILIGTPGRLIDYFKQRVFKLDALQAVVLDEADRMFDLGFIKDLRYLLRRMPHPTQRQSMLFSATLSHRVAELAYEHMNNPESMEVAPDKRTADQVEQVLYHVGTDEKDRLLIGLLRKINPTRTLVFVNTKRAAEHLSDAISANGFSANVLSGDVPQRKRQSLIKAFANGELPILVATDVAARGLHIPDVSHVINYDLPQNAEDYVHRIGRTARAGATGDAISLACEGYVFSLIEIEEYLGNKIPVVNVEDDMLADITRPPRRRRNPDSRRRPPRRRSHSTG